MPIVRNVMVRMIIKNNNSDAEDVAERPKKLVTPFDLRNKETYDDDEKESRQICDKKFLSMLCNDTVRARARGTSGVLVRGC